MQTSSSVDVPPDSAVSTSRAQTWARQLVYLILREIERARRRDLGERNLDFAQLTMAVILGVAIVDLSDSLNRNFAPSNYRAVLLAFAVLLFLEMYIVLMRYHQRLELRYTNMYMFLDLFLAIAFVVFVGLLSDSWAHHHHLKVSLGVLAFVFVGLFFRQAIAFLDLIVGSKDVEEAMSTIGGRDPRSLIGRELFFANRDLRSRLDAMGFKQIGLFIPMFADLLGIGFALLAFTVSLTWWAWVGLAVFFLYELIMFGFVVGAATPGALASAGRFTLEQGHESSADRS